MIKKVSIVLFFCLILFAGWFTLNPENGFGLSFFGLTTFNKIPYFYVDIEVDITGKVQKIKKTHKVTKETIKNLIDPKTEILIISKGWSGAREISGLYSNDKMIVIKKKNKEAKKLYNKLIKEGKNVAISYHSTC
jgi:hypothetical protein